MRGFPAIYAVVHYIKGVPSQSGYANNMKVLIDCTQITSRKAGVGVYALNLVEGLLKHQSDKLEVWLLVQDDDPDFLLLQHRINVIQVPARIFRILPLRLILEQIYIPWLARKHKIDILHSLHYSFPLLRTRARRIVTIHDLTSFVMPEVHTRVKLVYFHFFIRAANRLADALIFVSKATESDWVRYFPNTSRTRFVVPLGKAPIYSPDLPVDKIDQVLERYKLARPYILYIGTIEPRKNLTRLVTAFALLAQSFPMHILVIAGMKGWMYEELFEAVMKLRLDSRVSFTGFVAEEDKPYLIAGAEAFVYPSLYEGFGIPVLEAIACGTPTLTSNRSSLPEVAGDAALLIDPENVEDIAFHLEQLLNDSELRDSLREKSIVQAALFNWARTAEETIRVYQMAGLKQ
jgi:glycosyltransferase involved in cell wall biosynthesis